MKNTFLYILLFSGIVACTKEQLPLKLEFEVYPPIGDSTTIFELTVKNLSVSRYYLPTLKFRWDFNGDSVWETSFESVNTKLHKFCSPGKYKIIVEVIREKEESYFLEQTIISYGRNKTVQWLIDPRDSSHYRIVKINEDWWMVDNLHYGKNINELIEQSNNNTVEYYLISDSTLSRNDMAVYNWFEAMNYLPDDPQGICPEGWHIPSEIEWRKLYDGIPQLFCLDYYGENGLSELHLDEGLLVTKNIALGEYLHQERGSWFWSSSVINQMDDDYIIGHFNFFDDIVVKKQNVSRSSFNKYGYKMYSTVRCIKD